MMIKKYFSIVLLFIILLISSSCKNIDEEINNTNPRNDTYYQILVRSFSDGDGDGIGDFKGITQKLDYLKELGITGIWLMPIHPSPTYHGYDVIDYYDVNSDYGTMADFEELCTKANEYGINVIIDLVINHTSDQCEWFKKALQNDPKYYNYYVFTDKSTNNKLGSWNQNIWHGASGMKYCGYFSNTMPDLNYFNEEVKEEVFNIGKYWLNKGVGGFRIDAAQHLYGTNEYLGESFDYFDNVIFLKEFRKQMREVNPDVYITGEINLTMESVVSEYFYGLDSPLDFPIASKVVSVANSNANKMYASNLSKIYNKYRDVDSDFISAPFLRNHDENRIASEFNNDLDKMKLAAEMLLALPGSPIIYYGEEVGMFGTKSNGELSNGIAIWDETRRLPINFGDDNTTTWFSDDSFNDVIKNRDVKSVREQLQDDESLLNTYKRILSVRNSNYALKYGNTFEIYEEGTTYVQGFYRSYQYEKVNQKVLVLHNLSKAEQKINIKDGTIIYISGKIDFSNIDLSNYSMAPKSTIIIDVTK